MLALAPARIQLPEVVLQVKTRSFGRGMNAASRSGAHAKAATVREPATVQRAVLPKLHGLKGILFDIDGTLTDSDPLHFIAFQELLLELGFQNGQPITQEFYNEHISGRHNPDIAAELWPDWTVSQQAEFSAEKEARFRALAGARLQPTKGLADFLQFIDSRDLPSVAVTNAPGANARMMLHGLGLDAYFRALVLGEECTRAKPFPDPYLEGMRVLGITAKEGFAVEDSPSGIAAAAAAGLPVVGITTSQKSERLLSAGACVTVSDFDELLVMLAQQ